MIDMTVTFDTDTIRLITLFENLTGAPVKDCIIEENVIYFVVDEGKIGLAIGKNGNVIKNAEGVIGKTIKVFEYSDDMCKFVKNLIPQCTEIKVRNEDDKIIIEARVEKNDRAMVIGRDGRNLKLLKEVIKRLHKVDDLILR